VCSSRVGAPLTSLFLRAHRPPPLTQRATGVGLVWPAKPTPDLREQVMVLAAALSGGAQLAQEAIDLVAQHARLAGQCAGRV